MRLDDMNSMQEYIAECSRYPLLTAEEEQDLGARIQAGDLEARNRLWCCNLRLVFRMAVRIANSDHPQSIPLADLVQHGNLGLERAIQGWEPERHLKFSTYAYYWILQKMIRGTWQDTGVIHIPVHHMEQMTHVHAGRRRRPDDSPIYDDADRARNKIVHSEVVNDQIEGHSPNPLDAAIAAEERAMITAAMADLPDLDRQAVELRYGLNDQEMLTEREIGERLGFSRAWPHLAAGRVFAKLENRLLAIAP